MSRGDFDKEGCFLTGLTIVVVVLFLYVVLDMYAGHRDMHHIRDLQRRVGQLEQQRIRFCVDCLNLNDR